MTDSNKNRIRLQPDEYVELPDNFDDVNVDDIETVSENNSSDDTSRKSDANDSSSSQKNIDLSLIFVDKDAEKTYNESKFNSPSVFYSPKDKISNFFWKNELAINDDFAIVTVEKSKDFGCIVHLDYEKILESQDIITGVTLSPFQRSVYDAVVTLCVAGNKVFSTTQIWQIISKNPNAKLTEKKRVEIVQSMFHISSYWISIIIEREKKPETWDKFHSSKNPFLSERKFYKKLQAAYFARALEFRGLAIRYVDMPCLVDGKEVVASRPVPEIWQLTASPILYQYASDKEQVASVALKLLDTFTKNENRLSLKSGDHSDELVDFLAREIDTMRKTAKSHHPYSHIIRLQRLYEIDGINAIQQDSNSLKKKKKKTRDKVEKILSNLKDNGLIQGHKFHTRIVGKATTFYSVEILF